MKRIIVIGLAALSLAGCAATSEPVAAPSSDPRESIAVMVTGCADSIKDVVASPGGDAASKVAAVGAIERLCGGGGGQLALAMQQRQAPPAPQSLAGVLWQSALQVADIALRGYGIKANRDVAIVQSNNQASTTIASYGAFSAMGGYIRDAGIAGYPYVQAPGDVTTTTTTTTNTLSGTGVIGTGSYVGPVTRTCNGGGAGAGGGTTAGAPGGGGGAATC